MFRFFFKVLIAVVVFFALLIGIGFYLSPQDTMEQADAVVVVSGGETASRTEEGVKIFKKGFAKKMIFSGAARSGTSNAFVMRDIALRMGISADDVILEEESSDTFENAKFVLGILQQNDWHSIILVTSPYHQRRAYLSFLRESRASGYGLSIINHSTVDSAWRKNGWWMDEWARTITLAELQKILFIHALSR